MPDPVCTLRQGAHGAHDPAVDQGRRKDADDQTDEDQRDYRYVDVPDCGVRVVLRLRELLGGPRLHFLRKLSSSFCRLRNSSCSPVDTVPCWSFLSIRDSQRHVLPI